MKAHFPERQAWLFLVQYLWFLLAINIDKRGISNSLSQSKIIRISLLTPNLGNGIENIDQLKKSELAWTTSESKEIKNNNNSYEVIYENDILKPWKLILKK